MIRRKKPKIGLALGSGAARGLAHIGVLKALKERDISIDLIAGSSIGALVGACFARGIEPEELQKLVLETNWKKLLGLADFNLALLFKGFVQGKKIKELLRAIIGDVEFKDLKIPLAVVATDITTGEEVLIKEGSVVEAVRASISMPGIFMPVKFGKKFLIDGGVIDPVPVEVVKNMGAKFIIASNVIIGPKKKKEVKEKKENFSKLVSTSSGEKEKIISLNGTINKLLQKNKNRFENFQKFISVFKTKVYRKRQKIDPDMPSIFEVIIQSIYTMENEIVKLKLKNADVVITPDIADIKVLDFYHRKRTILEGYKAAIEILSQ